MVLRYATRRGNQRGLGNLRFAAIDAQRFPGSLSCRRPACAKSTAIIPQPYHLAHEADKRLLTPAFLAGVHGVLEPGGLFFVQTDNLPYWNY